MSPSLARRTAELLSSRLGWPAAIDGSLDHADGSALREGLLRERFLSAVHAINPGPDGRPWLDDARLEDIWYHVTRALDGDLISGNEQFFMLLQRGIVVPGLVHWQDGRSQVVQLVDWEHPDRNDLRLITDLPVERTADGGRTKVVLDLVALVNGIPFAVVACASPHRHDGIAGAIDTLRALTGTRDLTPSRALPKLFRYVQVLVAADEEEAKLGTISSLPEHFAPWRTTAPHAPDQVATELGVFSELNQFQMLMAGVLRPESLLDLVRSFSLFREVSGQRARIVARYQQYRAVLAMVDRLRRGATSRGRGGLLWHTQGSGKSLTMTFLIRRIRIAHELRGYKIVIASDRIELKEQLTPVLSLSGETPEVAATGTDARALLSRTTPSVIQLMMQQLRPDDSAMERTSLGMAEDGSLPEGMLNDSERIVVLVDEAHRTQSGTLHARLRTFLPNAAMIGFTGTPIVRGPRSTREIFGSDVDDPYTLVQAVRDSATVPIRYEARPVHGRVESPVELDQAYLDLLASAYTEDAEDEAARDVRRRALESESLIRAKARDMLLHWAVMVAPGGFKGIVVAVSRLAAVRYRAALLKARAELVAAVETYLRAPGDHGGFKARDLALVAPRLALLRAVDFVPVISQNPDDISHPERSVWREWTAEQAKTTHIARFGKPFPGEFLEAQSLPSAPGADPWSLPAPPPRREQRHGGDDPWSTGGRPISPDVPAGPADSAPIALVIVQNMLLTGYDAPLVQALYIDRTLRGAPLLQAVARTNRTSRKKPYGLIVDYVVLVENLDQALADYDLKDLTGMREELLAHEFPLLEAAAETLEGFLAALGGVPSHEADWERLLNRLDEQSALRARFDELANAYLTCVERLLPRWEALAFNELTAVTGKIQWRLRRRLRDTGTGVQDPYRYGAALRDLLDRHLRTDQIVQKTPPAEVTDPGFRVAVDALRTDQARALEYRHALRSHYDRRLSRDPARIEQLSRRLDQILSEHEGAWQALAEALGHLVDETLRAESEVTDQRLDPETEGPVFTLLITRLNLAPDRHTWAAELTVDLMRFVRAEISPPHFMENEYLQDNFRKALTKRIASAAGIGRAVARPIAESILGMVREDLDRFRR